MLKTLKQKIKGKNVKIGVIGLGYVGLPLAVAFAKSGFMVTGIEIDRKKVRLLNQGRSYIMDVPSAAVKEVRRSRHFRATDDYGVLSSLDVVIICVPTPLSKTEEPDISFIIESARRISTHLKRGQLIVLESTTYPGTTDEVVRPILEKSGLRAEKDFLLAFSPERVDPGNRAYGMATIPKVVGGIGAHSTAAAKNLYGVVVNAVVEVSSAKAAEMVKLLENTFRSVNIGLINEVALLSNRLNIDIWEVIEAAKTKPFGFMPFYPGPGIGGHCLPIDPLYLSWKSRLHGFEAKMIELASSINEAMPLHVAEKVNTLLNQRRTPLKNAAILVLGVAYKKDIDDIRESPALDVIEHLLKEGACVSYSDPYVRSLKIARQSLKSCLIKPELLKKQDCVLLLTDHSDFDHRMIVDHSRLILDTRNALKGFRSKKYRHLFFL